MDNKPVKEKKITVSEAVKIAFSEMGSEFSILALVDRTRAIVERPALMDGTITKELRDARGKEKCLDYEIIDQNKAIYHKLKEWNNPAIKNQLELF